MREFEYKPAADVELAPSARWKSVRREVGLVGAISRRVACLVCDAYLKAYHRLSIEGAEHVPARTPFVLAANHSSHLDIFALAAALPRGVRASVFPIAAGDVFFTSPARSLFSALFINALPMWRKAAGAHALDDLRARLEEGSAAFALFPEGARSRDGKMLPFKPGIGMMTAATKTLIVPCYLEGAFEALPPGAWLPRPRKMRLRIGAPIRVDDVANEREGWQEVARRVRVAVEGLQTAKPPSGRVAE